MKNILLIINPKAGKSKAKTALFDIIDTLGEYDTRVITEITRYSGHARDICKSIDDDIYSVICAGGDGTLNEVIAGVIESKKDIPIGYIPMGSTNDFATTLHLSKDFKKATLDITNGSIKSIDVGRFAARYFTYVASFGAFTKSSYSTPQDVKNILGHTAYVLEGLKDIPTIKAEHIKLTVDGGKVYEGDYIFGAIANTTSVGGILSLKEDLVTMNDGKFEMILVKNPTNITELNKCINDILTKNLDSSDMIEFANVESVKVESETPLTWSLDGERANTDGNVFIRNIKQAVKMILPRTVSEVIVPSDNRK